MTANPSRSDTVIMTQLGAMMFLQFFVWGGWYVSMTGFINKSEMSAVTGAAYTVAPIAAILSPFILGLIVDRLFSSERVLGVLHIIGGLALIAAPFAAKPFALEAPAADASVFYKLVLHDLPAYRHPFILLLLLHMLCYMPTLALTTSLSFHNLTNQEKQFPWVRVLGTIGWIVGNIAVSMLPGKDVSASQFYMAGGAGVLLGLYSFSLPHTPPPLKGKKPSFGEIIGMDSLALLKRRSYLVFIVCSFLLCIPLAGYYQQARNFVEASNAVVNKSATFTMSFGQMSEVVFMCIMPLLFARLGVKWMLLIGMLAWVLRYGLFYLAVDDQVMWMILMGVILHGICYDFFFVTGMIYVDKAAPPTVRGQAQGFLVLVTQGLGLGIGAKVFFWLWSENQTDAGLTLWKNVWLAPCLFALAVAVVFFLLFNDKLQRTPAGLAADAPKPELSAQARTNS